MYELWLYVLAPAGLRSVLRRRTWSDAAHAAGLQPSADPDAWFFELRDRPPLHVHLEEDTATLKPRVVIECSGSSMTLLHLRRESVGASLSKQVLGTREIEVGDPRFDEAFYVQGIAAVAHALLDARARGLLLALHASAEVEMANGRLYVSAGVRRARLNILRQALDAAARLTATTSLADRLADSTVNDPLPAVRMRCLRCLVTEFAPHAALDETIRRACADPDAEIRLVAAARAGAAEPSVLSSIAHDPETPDRCAAEAVQRLGDRLTFDDAHALLDRSLRRLRRETARRCLERIGRVGGPDAHVILAKVIAIDGGELAVCAAGAVQTLEVPAIERVLIAALQRNIQELPGAAAESLGRGGTVSAVLPLKDAMDRWTDAPFRRVARQAIAQIQSRAAGASAGQLSLGGSETGQLSIAAHEAGQLSVAPDGIGRVSLGDTED